MKPCILQCGNRQFAIEKRTHIMGILNVTPDSFSDGGDFFHLESALKQAQRLLEEGADILDIGGESTRPFATEVTPEEEIQRVVPVIRALAQQGIRCTSIDTRHAKTAQAALDAGACWLNDVSGLSFDPHMPSVASQFDAVVIMHMRGTPFTMQNHAYYKNVALEVHQDLEKHVQHAIQQGVAKEKLIIDPGIGFGKGLKDNLALLCHLEILKKLQLPILVGPSRKRFLGEITGIQMPKDRDMATIGAVCASVYHGAHFVRVHNVKACKEALQIVDAIQKGME